MKMQLNLEIQYKQPSIGYCSVYLFANIFKNPKFLEYTKYERFKGCQEAEINEMLLSIIPELAVAQVAVVNPIYPPLPIDYIYSLLSLDERDFPKDITIPIVCYLLVVRLIDADIHHHVAVLIHDGIKYYLDPYNNEMFVLTDAQHLSKQFIDCCMIERFRMRESDYWAVLNGENLGYKLI